MIICLLLPLKTAWLNCGSFQKEESLVTLKSATLSLKVTLRRSWQPHGIEMSKTLSLRMVLTALLEFGMLKMRPTQWHTMGYLKLPLLWNGTQRVTVLELWSKVVVCTHMIQEHRALFKQATPTLVPKQSNLLGWMTTSIWHQVSTSRLNVSSQFGTVVI